MKRGLRDFEEARCRVERFTFIDREQATNLRLGDLVGHVDRLPARGRSTYDQLAKSGAHVLKEALHAGQQYGSELGRVAPGAPPLKQFALQLALEGFDRLSDARLRQIDLPCRPAHALQAGHGFERAELPKRGKIMVTHGHGPLEPVFGKVQYSKILYEHALFR